MSIKVTSQALDEIRLASAAAHPCEACGLLIGRRDSDRCEIAIIEAVKTRNVHPRPETHFEVEPQALINAYRAERNGGLRLIGYFHSHPKGKPEPSVTDQTMAPGDGRIWAVEAQGDVRFWRDAPGGFEPVEFEIDDR